MIELMGIMSYKKRELVIIGRIDIKMLLGWI